MPLSGAGLCEADSMTPRSAPSERVKNATAGVGNTPSLSTSTPAPASPATTAASRNSPEARGSRPTTAIGRPRPATLSEKAPTSPSTRAAATDRPSASGAVRSRLATPRTPSVPKRRPNDVTPRRQQLIRRVAAHHEAIRTGGPGHPPCRADDEDPSTIDEPGDRMIAMIHVIAARARWSALAVLRSLAGLLEAVLLPLLDARVAGEEPGALQRRTVVDVDGLQGARDAETQSTRLAGDAAAAHAGDDVELALGAQHHERLVHDLLVHLVGEVLLERTAVDLPLAGARDDADARDGLLAAAGAGGRTGRDRLLAELFLGHLWGLGGVLRRNVVGVRVVLGALSGLLDAGGLGHCYPRFLLAGAGGDDPIVGAPAARAA